MRNGNSTPFTYGIIRFSDPDYSVGPADRGLFAVSASKEIKDLTVPLYDYRSDKNLTKGPAGLDIHGFTVVSHSSALGGESWLGPEVEEVYLKEVEELIKQVTGAKYALVNNVAFRRKLSGAQKGKEHYAKRGSPLDKAIEQAPRDKPFIAGNSKDKSASAEPNRSAHVDYSMKELRDTVRHCRFDISAVGKSAIEAWDSSSENDQGEAPRVAAYSIWRPLRTVERDPLAVALYGSIEKDDFLPVPYRALSESNEDGEYIMEALIVKPPKDDVSLEKQKWYIVPNQTPDEVLIIKFADTGAEKDPENVAGFAAHASPAVEGISDDTEVRESVEVRIIAFW